MIGADIEVSNSHEPSYYEIALTNRQVVVAFVILLVCLLCAFFSGVWIGRESTMRAQEQLSPDGPAQAQEKKEGQALEEFDFFDESKRPAAASNASAEPERPEPTRPEPEETLAPEPEPRSRETTLAEDLGGDSGRVGEDTETLREPAPAVPAPAPARPVVLPTAEERRRAAQAQAAPAPPAPDTKKPVERRAETPKPAAEAPIKPKPLPEAAPAAAAGSVVIQVFSSPEKDQAERIRDRLVRGGQKAYLSPVQVANRTMYRVRIGPFETRDKANKAADQVRKGYKLDTWVTE